MALLREYQAGAAAELAEISKSKTYSKQWKIDDPQRARLIFFGIELTGCLGPEAREFCKALAHFKEEGPEGLKKIYESISIGFQTNRAIRLDFMMKHKRYGGWGLGMRMVTGLG